MSKPAVTVYFRGFPEDINNEELEDIFARYGNIIKCFIHKSRTYGMVEYEEQSSCAEAINSLNNKPPYNLYLNMAKSQPQPNKIDTKKMGGLKNNHPMNVESVNYKEEAIFYDENDCKIDHLIDEDTNEVYVPIRYAPNIRRIVKRTPVHNNSLSNGCFSDIDDSASVFTSVSNSNRKINYNNTSHNIKIERSFEDTDSQNLQKGNNPKTHKMPYGNRFNNISAIKEEPKSQSPGSGDEGKPRLNKKFPKNKFGGNGEGDWKITAPVIEERICKNVPKNTSTPSTSFCEPSTSAVQVLSAPKKGAENWKVIPPVVEEKICRNSTTFKSTPFAHSTPKNSKVFYEKVDLPKNQFTQVQIEHAVSDTIGWAQLSDKIEEYTSFIVKVIESDAITPKPTKPEEGKLCLAQFENIWFRAIVLKTVPKLIVKFIDYGNDSEVDEIMELSPEFCCVPGYAVCVNLLEGAPCKLTNGLSIKVKPVAVKDDVVDVHVENGIYNAQELPSASAISSPLNGLTRCQESMMKNLAADMEGVFQMILKLSSTQAVAYFLPHFVTDDATKLEKLSDYIEPNSSFKPKIGDLVAAENEGWNRGLILNIENGFKIAFIDYGVIKSVKEVQPLPDDFKEIPQCTCVFTATENILEKIEEKDDGVCFKITKINNDTIYCQTSDEVQILGDISFVLWKPEEKRKISSFSSSSVETVRHVSPPELKLKNGEDVKIIDEQNGFLFVRTKEGANILLQVEKYLAEFSPKAPKITKEPEVGQYVAAQYENDWYRAVIQNIKQNNAEILYIDYGNTENKPFFSLKALNEQIKKEPFTLIKIKVKGFTDKNFSEKARGYFQHLSDSNQILKATFEGSPQSGVELQTKDGKSVSAEIIKMDSNMKLKTFQSRKEFYMKVNVPGNDEPRPTSIKVEEIPLGKVAIKFLHEINLEEYELCICVHQPNLLHKIHVELLTQMTKYVNLIAPKEPYRPIMEEVVLVQNLEKWYRAIVVNASDEGFYVFFLDYGFSSCVTAEKIRRIPKEFINEFSGIGNFAIMEGLPPKPSRELIDRLENLLLRNEVYNVEVLSKDDEDNYFVIFPDILDTLRSENLI